MKKDKIIDSQIGYDTDLYSIIRKAIGERTMKQFCEETDLSIGYMSRLLNGKLNTTPNVKTLAKIAAFGAGNKKETFTALLKVCGRVLTDEEMQNWIRVIEQKSLQNEASSENHYNANLSAPAMGLLFSRLLAMGITLQPQGRFELEDGAEFCIKEFQLERVVAIPGLCGNNHVITTERDILWKLLRHSLKRQNVSMYLVITDNEAVYEFISNVMENNVECGYVLLIDGTYTSFKKQKFLTTEKIDAPFNFL